MSDENIIPLNGRVVPPDLAPRLDPNAGYDPLVAVNRRELVEIRDRLETLMVKSYTLHEWLNRILGEGDGDVG